MPDMNSWDQMPFIYRFSCSMSCAIISGGLVATLMAVLSKDDPSAQNYLAGAGAGIGGVTGFFGYFFKKRLSALSKTFAQVLIVQLHNRYY